MTLALVLRYWHFAAIGLLAVLLGVQTHRIGNLKADVREQKAAVALWEDTSKLATAQATADKLAKETAQQKVNNDAQTLNSSRLAAFRDGVRSAAARTRTPKSADMPILPYATSVFDGPGTDTVVSKIDAGLCGENTLRLIAAHDWALKLTNGAK